MANFVIATHNPFALLGDDEGDEPQSSVATAAAATPDSAGAKTREAGSAKQATREGRAADEHLGGGGARGQKPRAQRGGGGRGRGAGRGGYDRSYAQDDGSGPNAGDEFLAHPVSLEGGRGGRGARGGSRGRGIGFRGGRREYDRRDGTGRGHETEKRGGAGKGNWGQPAEDPSGWDEPVKSAWEEDDNTDQNGTAKEDQDAADGAKETGQGDGGEQGEEKEEEKEMLTLKEYEEKAKAKIITAVVERPEVDMGQFEGLTVYEKVDEGTGLESLEEARPKRTKSKGKKDGKREVIQTSFRVGEPVRRGRGGRDGRGGRGGRFDRTGSGEGYYAKQDEGDDADGGGYKGYRGHRGEREQWGSGPDYGRGGRRGGYGSTSGTEAPLDMADTSTFPSLGH